MRRGVLGGKKAPPNEALAIQSKEPTTTALIANLNSYVPGGAKAFDPPKKKGSKPVDASGSIPVDLNFNAANDATSRLMKKSGQAAPAAKLDTLIQDAEEQVVEDEQEVAATKKPRKKRQPEETNSASAAVRPPPFEETLEKHQKVENRPIPPKVTPITQADVTSLEDYKKRETEISLFSKQIVTRESRVANDYIMKLPKVTGTLQYSRAYAATQWYGHGVETVANSPGLSFQKVPLLTRVYLQTFLREADPKVPKIERPCFNLDRDPFEGENRMRCIAHILAGFRLREIVFPEQEIQLNDAMAHGAAPELSPIHEMCYLCHIYFTTMAALHQKSHYDEKRKKDLTDPALPSQRKRILNKFQVDANVPYGYDSRCMITGDIVSMGIWGFFPEWSEKNYVQVQVRNAQTDQLLRGFAEREQMLFRLPRIPSHQNESESAIPSTRSALTGSAQ